MELQRSPEGSGLNGTGANTHRLLGAQKRSRALRGLKGVSIPGSAACFFGAREGCMVYSAFLLTPKKHKKCKSYIHTYIGMQSHMLRRTPARTVMLPFVVGHGTLRTSLIFGNFPKQGDPNIDPMI